MSKVLAMIALSAAIAAPLSAEVHGSRIRVQNTGTDGRVEIALVEESVTTVELSVPGGISGESITVEAPADRIRLRGGSMDGDPLLEGAVARKLRESSPQTPTVVVIGERERWRTSPRGQDHRDYAFTDVAFADVGFAYGAGYVRRGARCITESQRPPTTRARRNQSGVKSSRRAVRGGGFSSRGMLPRR